MDSIQMIVVFLRALLRDRAELVAEILALRRQLAILERTMERTKLHNCDRIFSAWLPRIWTGYRGRLGIYELLPIDAQVRGMIVQRKSAGDILVAARTKGFKLMREDGWAKVLKGITTVEEIMRVTKVSVDALSK